jgi:hypothetical protein
MADHDEPENPEGPADSVKAAVPLDAATGSTPEISGPMFDVHAPHESIHTWKSFFIHLTTIVVGLCIAVGLEQAMGLIYHRHQVAEMREALRLEREGNRKQFAQNTRFWRWETAALKNNLLVLQYLQQHPGTPQEKLPGDLFWNHRSSTYTSSSWEAANQTGITLLMPRDEVAETATLYRALQRVDESSLDAWLALNDAQRYTLLDADPSHFSTAAIAEEITLTENALTKHFLNGVTLQNLHAFFPDFPATVTNEELQGIRNVPDQATAELLAPADALTKARLKLAGWDAGDIPLATPRK